ncbi:MAG: RNA methyltransferase [Planctomycetes bacterium]|nr:RNA methyltransferase [Planctomycetota bacterium]
MITSRNNPLVKELASLKKGKGREQSGLAIAEGTHLVIDALESGLSIRTLIVSEDFDRNALDEITAKAETPPQVTEFSRNCFEKISDLSSPEGIGVVFEISHADMDRLVADSSARLAVAAGVQDPGNAGAIVRVAEAAGATGCIFLDGIDVHSPKFIRGAQGSSFRLPCAMSSENEFLASLKKHGTRLYVTALENAKEYDTADYTPPIALCFGNEGLGVPKGICDAADGAISIPMSGKIESLNVSVAAGIILYRARRDWK